MTYIASSNNSLQFTSTVPKKEEKQENKNNFRIEPQSIPENKKEDLIEEDDNKEKKEKRDIQYKDIPVNENKKPETEKVEIQRKKEEIKEKKRIIEDDNKNDKSKNKNDFNIIELEDHSKDDNIIITSEIKTKQPQKQIKPEIKEQEDQKASDIIKQSLNENKINENLEDNNNENDFGGYDRLLISDDDDEEDKKDVNKEQKPLANAFIDTKKDINLGKVRIGKDGGNFLNNFNEPKKYEKYEKGGIEKLENKLRQEQIQSVVSNPNDDDDYLAKLREVEKEKNQKLKEYRERLTKIQKEICIACKKTRSYSIKFKNENSLY